MKSKRGRAQNQWGLRRRRSYRPEVLTFKLISQTSAAERLSDDLTNDPARIMRAGVFRFADRVDVYSRGTSPLIEVIVCLRRQRQSALLRDLVDTSLRNLVFTNQGTLNPCVHTDS